jgi:PTH1 family peptidyl-tRNA hydrolase
LSRALIVGLGNPGKRYNGTRHNIGREAVGLLAQRWGVELTPQKAVLGESARYVSGEREVFLLQPDTYMNLSGEAVTKALHKWNVPVPRLLVLVDDVYLPFGTLRLRDRGSAGGHNGLLDIERRLRTRDYCRLKIGVSLPSPGEPLEEYVLKPFSPTERLEIPALLERVADKVEIWLLARGAHG